MAPMDEAWIELGTVTAPSGVLAFAMAGWADYWPQMGAHLSRRGQTVSGTGGIHVRDGITEAVIVHANPHQPLPVSAVAAPSPFDGSATIAVLEVELNLPWQRVRRRQCADW